MTRAELWDHYLARNPSFAGPGNVIMSAAGLRKLFDQTWDYGEAYGEENALGGLGGLGKEAGDLFAEMFGEKCKGGKVK